ncbi:RTA1 like protein-domain-containing protein, partial [Xylariaceae sp. FL0255]
MPYFPNETTDGKPFDSFGPHETCKLNTCPIEFSIFRYRPSLAANTVLLALFFILFLIHLAIGIRTKGKSVPAVICVGCLLEVIGYVGRIMLWINPFGYIGFVLQILFLTVAPVFLSAAIYVTVFLMMAHLNPNMSRVPPKLYYRVFITSDVFALVFQALGGILSTLGENSAHSGLYDTGVDVALTGLSLQVATMGAISVVVCDYLARYIVARGGWSKISRALQLFTVFESLGIIFILLRCAYRVAELSQGFTGPLYHDQGLFIGLEGVAVLLAVAFLAVAHPGLAFRYPEPGKDEVVPRGEFEMMDNNN